MGILRFWKSGGGQQEVSDIHPMPTTGPGIGAPADTVASDDTGTWSLIALIKRLLGKLPAALTTSGNLKVSMQEGIVRSWTDITPATIATTPGTDLIAAATGGNLNIISDIGFQNVTTSAADLTLKKGGTTFAVYTIPASSGIEVGFPEGDEWRFSGAFTAMAGTGSAIKVTHGRYRVAAV